MYAHCVAIVYTPCTSLTEKKQLIDPVCDLGELTLKFLLHIHCYLQIFMFVPKLVKVFNKSFQKFSTTMLNKISPRNECAVYLHHTSGIHYVVVLDVSGNLLLSSVSDSGLIQVSV